MQKAHTVETFGGVEREKDVKYIVSYVHHPLLIFVLEEAIMDRFIYAQKTGAVDDD